MTTTTGGDIERAGGRPRSEHREPDDLERLGVIALGLVVGVALATLALWLLLGWIHASLSLFPDDRYTGSHKGIELAVVPLAALAAGLAGRLLPGRAILRTSRVKEWLPLLTAGAVVVVGLYLFLAGTFLSRESVQGASGAGKGAGAVGRDVAAIFDQLRDSARAVEPLVFD